MLGSLEDIEASVEDKKDGGRDDECDGDMDGTVSSGNVDPNRVKVTWLAAESQQTRNNARIQQNDLPVSPEKPAHSQIPCHGVPRTNRRCRRISFEPINISQTRKVKITYLHQQTNPPLYRAYTDLYSGTDPTARFPLIQALASRLYIHTYPVILCGSSMHLVCMILYSPSCDSKFHCTRL